MERTLIIIPAYNVAKQIRPIFAHLEKYKKDCLFINDGSSDDTLKIIRQEGFRVINIPYNSGVSNAIIEGLKYALYNNYDCVILMDADGQHNPNELNKFINALGRYNIVFGNRFDSIASIPSCKIIANTFASAIYKEVSNCFIPDVACGYKAFRLTQDIIEYLIASDGYSIVYRLVNYSILMNLPIFNVSINAIYYSDNFLCTRTDEIIALLTSVIELNSFHLKLDILQETLNSILKKILEKQDFDIWLSNIHFFAFYISKYNSYIFQAPLEKIYDYYLFC